MYDIKQNKKTATSKIKGDETTFLHLATDTSCLHRWERNAFAELFWKARM